MRFVLLGIAMAAAIGSVVAAHIEPLGSSMPLPTLAVISIAVIMLWAWQRVTSGGSAYPAAGCSFVMAGWSVLDALAVSELGLVSHSLALQALAFTAFAVFAIMKPPTADTAPATGPRRLASALIPVVALGLGLWWLLATLNPVSSSRPPEGEFRERLTTGEVQLTLYRDGISATTPEGSWSYSRRGADNVRWPNQNFAQSPLVTSPDGAYVAVGFVLTERNRSYGDSDYVAQEVLVFEAKTGKPVIKVFGSTFVNVQLTNSAALIGRDAYSLETGQKLWHSDDVPLGMLSMSGTPERFIADARCASDIDHLLSCELDLIDAADGSALGTVSALGDAQTKGFDGLAEDVLVVDGWVLDRALEPIEAPEIHAEPFTISAEMVARNLDTGETVPVGPGAGLESTARRLGIRPPSPSANWYSGTETSTATSWFDPKTKQVQG